jgi:hypothetical protein
MVARRQWEDKQGRQGLLRPGLSSIGALILLCSLLAMLLSACTSFFATPTQSGTPTSGATSSTATAIASPTARPVLPTITLQVSGCPSLSINWDSLVGTHANVNKVQKVICGSLTGVGTLDALVGVRYYSPDARLDYYVYDNLGGTPSQRFSRQGLLNGDALISSVGTIVTAEINPDDPIKGLVDLFKEYQWNGATFGQVLFPGIYPDVTRYQAEQAQAQVKQELAAGQTQATMTDGWRLAPAGGVTRLARNIFHWTNFSVALPLHSALLTVLPITVTNLAAGGGGFIAVVHHLNENPANIFEIEQVNSINGSAGLNSPVAYAHLSSPVSVSGSSQASGSILGQAVLYDDVYTIVGNSGAIHSPASSGYVQFTVSIRYSLAPGLEEGVVAFFPTAQSNIALSNQAILVKVLLSA